MIVLDTSIVGSIVLDDEPPPPADIADAILRGTLIAPAHWPFESANMLLVARRRERLNDRDWRIATGEIEALGVGVMPPPSSLFILSAARIAQEHRLTFYDAAYLQLAIDMDATLATLDVDLAKASTERAIPLLTYA